MSQTTTAPDPPDSPRSLSSAVDGHPLVRNTFAGPPGGAGVSVRALRRLTSRTESFDGVHDVPVAATEVIGAVGPKLECGTNLVDLQAPRVRLASHRRAGSEALSSPITESMRTAPVTN